MRKFKCVILAGLLLFATSCASEAPVDDGVIIGGDPVSESSSVSGEKIDTPKEKVDVVKTEDPLTYWWDNFDTARPSDNYVSKIPLQDAYVEITRVGSDLSCTFESAELTCTFAFVGGTNYYKDAEGWKTLAGDIDVSQLANMFVPSKDQINQMIIGAKDNQGLDVFDATFGVDTFQIGFDRSTGYIAYWVTPGGTRINFDSVAEASVPTIEPSGEVSASDVTDALNTVKTKIEECVKL